MNPTIIALQKVRELLQDPRHWTRHTLARNIDRNPVDPGDPNADCWCTIGAVSKIVGDDEMLLTDVVIALQRKSGYRGSPQVAVGEFNDEHNHIEVLRLLDHTIGSLK